MTPLTPQEILEHQIDCAFAKPFDWETYFKLNNLTLVKIENDDTKNN